MLSIFAKWINPLCPSTDAEGYAGISEVEIDFIFLVESAKLPSPLPRTIAISGVKGVSFLNRISHPGI